ncbi:MAG: nucleotidyltransferase family protein [Sphingobacteriales bacterium]|nr:nucleotidyltransferase family protein [Sphingobacteriales bacterium]
MPDKQMILTLLKNIKPSLEKKYGVKELALFGSYSRNEAKPGTSDVDVMVEFSQPIGLAFVELADELEDLLQMKVDLVSRKAIKPKYFALIKSQLIYV